MISQQPALTKICELSHATQVKNGLTCPSQRAGPWTCDEARIRCCVEVVEPLCKLRGRPITRTSRISSIGSNRWPRKQRDVDFTVNDHSRENLLLDKIVQSEFHEFWPALVHVGLKSVE